MALQLLARILLLVTIQQFATDCLSGANLVTLDRGGLYNVSWTYDDTDITFTLHVRTNGWVGFGLSPNGGMAHSDIVSVEAAAGGTSTITDRHGTDVNTHPPIDDEQDWVLISREVSDDVTRVVMSRKLLLCRGDGQDMSISTDTVRLIYAYGPESTMTYHGTTRRGSKSLYLLSADISDIPERPADTRDHDFLAENLEIPSKETTYWCTLLPMPTLSKKHHAISFEPVIQAGNEMHVHHIIIYGCHSGLNGSAYIEANNHSHECYGENMPEELKQCQEATTLFGWAVGGERFSYPANAGLSVGGEGSDMEFILLETHYDNPEGRAGVLDNSGLRMSYTEQLRTHDVDGLSIGHVGAIVVPPNRELTDISFMCDSSCTESTIPSTGITVFAGLLHSHLLGRKIILRHTRANGYSDIMLRDLTYDFNYQENRHFSQNIILNKGDSLQITCSMASASGDAPTYGGLATAEEMCLAYIYYYPKIPLTYCSSSPVLEGGEWEEKKRFYATIGVDEGTLESAGYNVRQATQSVDWTPEVGQIVEDAYFNYDHVSVCSASAGEPVNYQPIPSSKFSRSDSSASICEGQSVGGASTLNAIISLCLLPLLLLVLTR